MDFHFPPMNLFKANLKRHLLLYIGGLSLLLVFLYSLLIASYFELGIDQSTKLVLELDAKHFEKKLRQNPNAVLPTGANLLSYRSRDEMAADLQLLFPAVSDTHRLMQTYPSQDVIEHGKPEAAEAAKRLCNGEVCDMIFFYSYQLYDKSWLYMAISFSPSDFDEVQIAEFRQYIDLLISIAIVTLVVIAIFSLLLLHFIGKPIQRLTQWTDSLNLESFGQNPPDFYYEELNLIAQRLHSAFQRITQVLANEHRFLRNASHELRTPIAVISGNIDILNKLSRTSHPGSVEQKAIDRLTRASATMHQLIETLLWLSKDTTTFPEPETFNLSALTADIIEENQYLLEGKTVTIDKTIENGDITFPLPPFRIILTNLIRNAFQYTNNGTVTISYDHQQIIVCNHCQQSASADANANDYGFGLGLILVEQIAEKLGWHYHYERTKGGRRSTLLLTSS